MSERAQFDGMRVHHDEHRRLTQNHDYRSWRDCDTCIAIAVVDELDARITAAEKVVETTRAYEPLFVSPEGETRDEWAVRALGFIRRVMYALWDYDKAVAALTDATEQGPRGGSK